MSRPCATHCYLKAMCHPTTMSRPCAIPLLCQGHVPPTTMSRPCAIPLLCQGHVPPTTMSRPCVIPLLCQGHVPSRYYVKAMWHKVISDHNIGQVVNTVELCHPATMPRPCATHCYMSRPCVIPLLCQGHVPSHYYMYVKAMCHPTTMSRPCATHCYVKAMCHPTTMSRPCAILLQCQGHSTPIKKTLDSSVHARMVVAEK